MSTNLAATQAAVSSRRPKWHPIQPPSPSPKILNLPRRNRHRRQLKKPTRKPSSSLPSDPSLDLNKSYYYETKKGKLERLFGEEREFSRSGCSNVPIVLLNSSASALSSSFSSSLSSGRRDRVEEEELGGEKWKFQADILRAECNFLRLEREVALKKLERNEVLMERTLKSTVQTLISGRKKIFQGQNVSAVLEEEIKDLASKLVELQRNSGLKDNLEVKNCSNFDKQTCLLQRRLTKIGGLSDENYVTELQDLAESSLSVNMSHENDKGSCVLGPGSKHESLEVEALRRKMEGLSKEMLQRIEEDFGSILSITAASSASTSKRIEYPESAFPNQESMSQEDIRCTGRCKAIVRRIVEQVRAETEQWSQMQGMLRQVREEMEELQGSCKFLEDRAVNSDLEVQRLQSAVQDWKEKALTSDTKANELETELSVLKGELEKLTAQPRGKNQMTINTQVVPLASSNELEKEKYVVRCGLKENDQTGDKGCNQKASREKLKVEKTDQIMQSVDPLPISLGKQLAKEKRMLRLIKEKFSTIDKYDKSSKQKLSTDGRRRSLTFNSGLANLKRSPFRDVGNLSPLTKQNNKTALSTLLK